MAPRRTCVGCRRAVAPVELVRLTSGAHGELVIGPGPGRGAWLCRDSPSCLDQAVRRQALGRALRADVVPEAVEGLRKLLRGSVSSGEAGAQVCEDGGSDRVPGSPPNEQEGP
ncbi:MAG TPA: YlxR family protein [Acidimicrobiales bacterium]